MQLYHFLCENLSTTKQELSSYVFSAPKKYKIYTIPKRTSGHRVIAHPAKELKRIQRALTKQLTKELPIHASAYAYKRNANIKDNASKHRKSKYLLKMDFNNFFHSITPDILFIILKKLDISVSKDDKYLLKQILFWSPSKNNDGKLVLSIGAPSSPLISNSIMFFFDQEIFNICKSRGIVYTRYSDDITLSTNSKNILFELPKIIKVLLSTHFNGTITINESKTIFTSKAHNRHVTGITITNDGGLSIGRKRKRYISSLIHKYANNELPSEDNKYLQGLTSFAFNVEPLFKARMIRKYSAKIIVNILRET